jgi:uncharacterized protein YcbX
MQIHGEISKLWRYPVKSMAGEELTEVFVGYGGFHGDRIFAFTSDNAPIVFPYHTARTSPQMICYRPRFKSGTGSMPLNWAAIENACLPVTPVQGLKPATDVLVENPRGQILSLDDPTLHEELASGEKIELMQSDRVIADCSPISLISNQTISQLSSELDLTLDPRRFRANIYVDFASSDAFAEDTLVGKTIGLGDRVMIRIMERDPRCAMIALDPDSGQRNKEILRHVSKQHDNSVGVYGVVLSEGVVRTGDKMKLID